jgi:hypothetical protein
MSESRAKNRPERTPLGQRNRLGFKDQDPNFVYRYINDKEDRLAAAQEAGYDFVVSDAPTGDKRAAEATKLGTKVSKQVGNGTTAFLMRIPKEFYQEDQKAKTQRNLSLEDDMKPDKAKGEYGPGLTND